MARCTGLSVAMLIASCKEHTMDATARVFEQRQHELPLVVPQNLDHGKRELS
jgi:hypothetical protein